jgi:hypothetical protein
MNRPADPGRIDGHAGGFTITEVLIACLLTTALLGMVSQSVVSVSSLGRSNSGALRQEGRRRDVLATIRNELENSSMAGRDLWIAPDGRQIRFSTLIGATQVAGEVTGVWSPPITIAFAAGRVSRVENGANLELARGVRDLQFRIPPGDACIEVTVTTRFEGADSTRSIRVHPRN